jgi:hypothetical protein
MQGVVGKQELFGVWESTEAFGNTFLDWSHALKDKKAQLRVEFLRDLTYSFEVFGWKKDDDTEAGSQRRIKITHTFRHLLKEHGKFELEGDKIKFQGKQNVHENSDVTQPKSSFLCVTIGDISGLSWTYQNEEDNTLRIR